MSAQIRAGWWMVAGYACFNATLIMLLLSWIAVTRLGVLESLATGALTAWAALYTWDCYSRALALYRETWNEVQ